MPGLPLNAPILTATGWKDNGSLRAGDQLVDPLGGMTSVLYIPSARATETYTVEIRDGSEAIVAADQLWEVAVRDTNNVRRTQTLTTEGLKRQVERKGYQVLIPKMTAFNFVIPPNLPIDPYLLGSLLAEGALAEESLSFACHSDDYEIVARIEKLLPEGHEIKSYGPGDVKRKITVGNSGGAQQARNTRGRNLILNSIHELGLRGTKSDTKFIPEPYLRASPAERLELLRGLLDGDGSIKADGNVRFVSASSALAEGVRELVLSLGGRARVKAKTGRSYTYKGAKVASKDEYWINGICGLDVNPFFLSRKAQFFKPLPKSDSYARRITAITPIGYNRVCAPRLPAGSHFVAYGLPLVGDSDVFESARPISSSAPRALTV